MRKDITVTKHREAMERGHLDDPREHVVDEGVQSLVHEDLEREMRNGFELVIDEQLRCHQHEAKRINQAHQAASISFIFLRDSYLDKNHEYQPLCLENTRV
jgi:hypothetical protein